MSFIPFGSQSIYSQRYSQSHLLPNIEAFRKILVEVGVTLTSSPDQPHILNKEQALVVRELTKYFEKDDTEACTNTTNFISGLKYLCKKEKHFKKFLIPTKLQSTSESNGTIYQDSLFSAFLKVPRLQDDIIEVLLEGITEVAMDDTQDTSWLRTLLKPLRCLPTIKHGETLAKKILDILEIASFTSQLEILEAIPEILPDNQCHFAAKQLTKLLDTNDELCGAIVDCLTALNLEAEIGAQIHDRILARILAGVSLKVYLILVKFLISDYKSQNLGSTLLKIRNSLDNMIGGGSSREKESDKTLIFNYLQTFAVTQKPVAEGWLNTISNIKVHADHKPIDLLIIFMLHHTSEIRKRVIEGIFRKRVSMGLFKVGLLDKLFDKYMTKQLLKDYMRDIIEIGCCLLRFAKDNVVAKFATALFESLFNHIYTGAIYRSEILSSLISLTSSNDHHTICTVLNLILSLVIIDPRKVQTHIALLMQLLEKLDTLDFKDVKLVFDILCYLLCGKHAEDFFSGFKDQIYNTIRKQLSCSERTIKHRGIISAIVMVKHTAAVEGGQADLSVMERSTAVANRPRGPAKDAVELLELVLCATGDNPELLCLYYDQLASILATHQPLDKYFLYWLYKKFEDDFETLFLTSAAPDTTHDLNFTMQYVLNKPEEIDAVFAVNIAGHIVCDKNDKILLLSPYFRVLRLLHERQHGHLSEIDSLLGCGILLPEVDDPDNLDYNQIKLVADCLFHCVNWFREIISAFVSQKQPFLQERVVRRLDNLIEVENKLFLFLKQVPGHNLPLSYFDSVQKISKQLAVKIDSKATKNPKKKIKSTSVVNDTTNLTMQTQEGNKPSSSSSKKASIMSHKIQFREIDTDIIRLIKYPLDINGDDHDDATSTAISLNLQQVKFILNDFISKLTLLTQNKDMGLSHLNDVSAEHLIQDCVHIVRNINQFLDTIVKKINELLEEPENCYTDEANDIKTCFGNILQTFYLIFQWPGFQQTGNLDLLKNIIRATRDSSSQSLASANKLILDFVLKISSYATNCLYLSHAVTLIKIMDSLYTLTVPTQEIQKKISATADTFLSKRWYDCIGKLDHGQGCNQNIDVLVKAHLKNANSDTISGIIAKLEDGIASIQVKDGCLNLYPAIDNKNFHVLYLGLCNALLNAIKTEIQSSTNMEHISLWLTVVETMSNLMTIAKTLKNRNNLSCFLKKTIGILKIFLTNGIPILEIMLKTNSKEVVQILRKIQTTTRFLHYLCCESKMTKDASVVTHIPSFKHTLESIIYRVKAALVANNCSAAFWLGNLRNRDTEGEDILSQSSVVSSNDNGNEVGDEQLPSDDDENIINNEYSDNDDSAGSEVYS